MSAAGSETDILPPKADIRWRELHVHFVPKADACSAGTSHVRFGSLADISLRSLENNVGPPIV
jgi:hypothetical protein